MERFFGHVSGSKPNVARPRPGSAYDLGACVFWNKLNFDHWPMPGQRPQCPLLFKIPWFKNATSTCSGLQGAIKLHSIPASPALLQQLKLSTSKLPADGEMVRHQLPTRMFCSP